MTKQTAPAIDLHRGRLFGTKLRRWFRAHGRDLPWRKTRDPYRILVSEVMLQQTQVSRVVPVPLSEALRFGVNLVQVGHTIVWGADAPATTHSLERLGYRVRQVSLEQFHRAGGSAACLVSRIHSLDAFEEVGPASAAA